VIKAKLEAITAGIATVDEVGVGGSDDALPETGSPVCVATKRVGARRSRTDRGVVSGRC
jgi:hypothetical protein